MIEEVTFRPYDTANYLRDEADIAAYLEAAAAEHDPATLATALGTVVRARNMIRLAEDTGLTREALLQAFEPDGNPTLATVMKVAEALGLELSFRAKPAA